MVWIKEETDNTAILYLSQAEQERLDIQWEEEVQGYRIKNKQEEQRIFQYVEKTLGYANIGYDINKIQEEDRAYLREVGIEEEIEFSIFIERKRGRDPITTFIRLLRKEGEEAGEDTDGDVRITLLPKNPRPTGGFVPG